jgi:hypothetical protein
MPLSNSQIRAIAIKRSVAKRAQPAAANDNQRSVRTPGAHRRMSTAMLQACLEASGFDQHAAR